MAGELLKTPLHGEHVRLDARLVEFAGYHMPVQYNSIVKEATAVRESVGMFDVSHMARLRFKGRQAQDYLEQLTANDVGALRDCYGQYSLLTNDTGGVVDDIIVYRIHSNEFVMVVNAANHRKDVDHLLNHKPDGVEFRDETADTFMIAVQGPAGVATLGNLSDSPNELDELGMFGTTVSAIDNHRCFCARSGYTGEDGFEIIGDASAAPLVWKALVEEGVVPCGLGARDVLRVEAGLPLYGHELTDEINPIEAGLGWVISKRNKEFLGCKPIYRVKEQGAERRLLGVRMRGKRIPQPGATVAVEGQPVGQITSGVYSPYTQSGIGFAFVQPDVKTKTPCTVEIRGAEEPGTLTGRRFFKRG